MQEKVQRTYNLSLNSNGGSRTPCVQEFEFAAKFTERNNDFKAKRPSTKINSIKTFGYCLRVL